MRQCAVVGILFFISIIRLLLYPTKANNQQPATQPTLHMPKEIKSLVACSQDVLARHLDCKTIPWRNVLAISTHPCFTGLIVLDDVGRTPYTLLREALCKATPQQLDRIERINPVSQQSAFFYFHLTWINLFLSICSASDPRINW